MDTQGHLETWWQDNENLLEFLLQLPDGCIPRAEVDSSRLILNCESEEVLREVKKLFPELIDRIKFSSLQLTTKHRQLKPLDVRILKLAKSKMSKYFYNTSDLEKINERIEKSSNPMSLVRVCELQDFRLALVQHKSPKRQNILFNKSLEKMMCLDKETLGEIDLKNFWIPPNGNPLDFIKIQSKDWVPPHLQEIYKLGCQQSSINAHVYPGYCPVDSNNSEYGLWVANIEFIEIDGILYNLMETLDFKSNAR